MTNYTLTTEGIQLPYGQTFQAHGHVNINYTTSENAANGTGIHFDPNNNQPGGAWIGESFIPWDAFGLIEGDCVTWVQVHGFNYHYGENGEEAVCYGVLEETPVEEEYVTNFSPTVREDCGDVYWSHPAFKGGFGSPNAYLIYINDGEAVSYEPGTEVLVAEDGEPWKVTLKAKYEGLTFEHQLGQHKGVGEVCEVVPEEPEEDEDEEETEEPDGEDLSEEENEEDTEIDEEVPEENEQDIEVDNSSVEETDLEETDAAVLTLKDGGKKVFIESTEAASQDSGPYLAETGSFSDILSSLFLAGALITSGSVALVRHFVRQKKHAL